MEKILSEMFPPRGDELLERACRLMTDELLEEISRADYGMDAAAHLAALRGIWEEARVPVPMEWEPKEVLSLVRWSEPDDPETEPGFRGERGHVMRAFCCAALLRAAADPADREFDGENTTLIQLLQSALFLGRGLPEAAGKFLTWRLPQMAMDDSERPFFAFGLVSLAALLNGTSMRSEEIDCLAECVEEAEAEVCDPTGVHPLGSYPGSFLAGTFFDLRHEAWRALARRVREAVPDSARMGALVGRIEATMKGRG